MGRGGGRRSGETSDGEGERAQARARAREEGARQREEEGAALPAIAKRRLGERQA